jgi:hypothetical protein
MKNVSLLSGSVLSGVALATLAASVAMAGDGAPTMPRVDGYRSPTDSPASGPVALPDSLIIENFESEVLQPGLSVSSGTVSDGNSVDADDGLLDGSANGKSLGLGSWFPFEPSNVTLTFAADDIGGAPRFAGVVVTDASGVEDKLGNPVAISVTLTVYLTDGTSLSNVFDILSQPADATDDVFIGVDLGALSLTGIDSIAVSAATPIAIDHVQYTGAALLALQYVRDDHDGDGRSEVAWFNEPGAKCAVWHVDGSTVTGGYTGINPSSSSTRIVGTGDFDGDGRADMLWYDAAASRYAIWLMNDLSATPTQIVRHVNSQWSPVIGDVDGDRKADIVFRRTGGGKTDIAVWVMNGTALNGTGLVSLDGEFAEMFLGNFDNDPSSEVLLRKLTGPDAGALFLANFNGALLGTPARLMNAGGQMEAPVSLGNRIAGVADTSADGVDDIIWTGPNGSVERWAIVNGAVTTKSVVSPTTGSQWSIVGFPDLNGDRRRDILFRASDGRTWAWQLNGSTIVSSSALKTVDMKWKTRDLAK